MSMNFNRQNLQLYVTDEHCHIQTCTFKYDISIYFPGIYTIYYLLDADNTAYIDRCFEKEII